MSELKQRAIEHAARAGFEAAREVIEELQVYEWERMPDQTAVGESGLPSPYCKEYWHDEVQPVVESLARGHFLRPSEVSDEEVETALRALHQGPPGVLRYIKQVDSYPGESPDDPDAYNPLPTTVADEKTALREAIEAMLSI